MTIMDQVRSFNNHNIDETSRYISYVLPQTFACEAMRGILLRGWGITYMPVWRGYLVTIAWIVATYAIFKKLVMKES